MTVPRTTDFVANFYDSFLPPNSSVQDRHDRRRKFYLQQISTNPQRNTGQERRRFCLLSTPAPLTISLCTDMISCRFPASPGDTPAYTRRILYFRRYSSPLWRVVPCHDVSWPKPTLAPCVCCHVGDIRVKLWSSVQGLNRLAELWEWPRWKKHTSFT